MVRTFEGTTMTDVEYQYMWYLGSRFGGYFKTDYEPEIEEFRNEKIAKYGAIFRMVYVGKRYLE